MTVVVRSSTRSNGVTLALRIADGVTAATGCLARTLPHTFSAERTYRLHRCRIFFTR